MRVAKIIGIGAALSAGLVAVNMVNADTTSTQAAEYGPGFALETNPFSYGLNFTQFDASLGTLTGVSVYFSDSSYGTVGVTNNSGEEQDYTLALSEKLSLTDTSNTSIANYTDDNGTAEPVSVGSGDYASSYVTTSGLSTTTTFTTDLSEFIGLGPIDLTLGGTGQADIGGATPFTAAASSSSEGYVALYYDYTTTSVPLPGSGPLALVGGLAMVGGLMLRRRMACQH